MSVLRSRPAAFEQILPILSRDRELSPKDISVAKNIYERNVKSWHASDLNSAFRGYKEGIKQGANDINAQYSMDINKINNSAAKEVEMSLAQAGGSYKKHKKSHRKTRARLPTHVRVCGTRRKA